MTTTTFGVQVQVYMRAVSVMSDIQASVQVAICSQRAFSCKQCTNVILPQKGPLLVDNLLRAFGDGNDCQCHTLKTHKKKCELKHTELF